MAFSVAQKAASQRIGGARRPTRRVVVTKAALQLKELPYAINALEPHMCQKTLEFHWGKHHRA